MKKLLASIALALLLTLAPSGIVAADDVCSNSAAATSAYCKDKATSDPIAGPDGILIKVADLVTLIAGIVLVIMMMIAGIRYITSSGDPNSVKKAKDTVIHSLIGLLVIVAAHTLIVLVVSRI